MVPVCQVTLGTRCRACGAAPGDACLSRARRPRGTGRYHRVRRDDGRRAAAVLDCRRCGACCQALPWWLGHAQGEHGGVPVDRFQFVNADPSTPEELCEPADRRISGKVGGRALRVVDGRCVALRGEVGRQVSCGAYRDRPSECRSFEPGSLTCLIVRARSGLGSYPGKLR